MRIAELLSMICALLLLPLTAHAAPITYTETAIASGSFGGTFTNQLVTLTGVGDTSNIVQMGSTFLLTLSSATLQVGTGAIIAFTDSMRVFDNQGTLVAGFSDIAENGMDILDTDAAIFGRDTLVGVFSGSGTALIDAGRTFPTALGLVSLSSTSGSATFSSHAGGAAATPEPATFVLLGTALLGAAGAARRRSRRA